MAKRRRRCNAMSWVPHSPTLLGVTVYWAQLNVNTWSACCYTDGAVAAAVLLTYVAMAFSRAIPEQMCCK